MGGRKGRGSWRPLVDSGFSRRTPLRGRAAERAVQVCCSIQEPGGDQDGQDASGAHTISDHWLSWPELTSCLVSGWQLKHPSIHNWKRQVEPAMAERTPKFPVSQHCGWRWSSEKA